MDHNSEPSTTFCRDRSKTYSLWISYATVVIALIFVGIPICAHGQGRGTGTCSQLMPDGKYHQVPCSQPPATPSQPSDNSSPPTPTPSTEERDRQARERQREREQLERERLRQEEASRAAKEAADQAQFIQNRDEAVTGLKGPTATATPGLKELNASSKSDPSKQAAAWRQVHCAAAIFGQALSALQTSGDYYEYGRLSVEAMKALDGKHSDVQCKPTPQVPSVGGTEVDVDKLRAAEKDLIDRGNRFAKQLKKSPAKPPPPQTAPPAAPPCTGTRNERMRCAQVRLNEINSKKIEGQTIAKINEKEKNRKELANLVLINNGLEKGEVSVTVDTTEVTVPAPRKHRSVGTRNP